MTQRIQSAQVVTAPDQSAPETAVSSASLSDGSPSLNIPVDLVIAALLILTATTASLLEAPPPVRIPLGVLLVLGLPGYGIVSSLFPSDDGPDAVARIALSVALSLAAVPFVALMIEWSPWRIERQTVTIGLMVVSLTTTVVAAGLRVRLPIEEQYSPDWRLPRVPPFSEWTRAQLVTGFAFGLAIILFAFGGFDVVKTRWAGEETTEFALYNADGASEFFPRDVVVGDAVDVQVSIANHEGKRLVYELVVTGAGRAESLPPDLTLDNGETWKGTVRFTVSTAGDDLPVRFELFRSDRASDAQPYRLLILIVHGIDPSAASS